MIAPGRFHAEVADLIVSGFAAGNDLSGHGIRPAGLLTPHTQSDVIRIVQAAGRHQAKLHVVSCGRNWGFGSTLSAKEGTWILNLSGLNRITAYDREIGSVHIEPGVTQIALYQELDHLGGEWFFNVTGAGHSTSILGNALERGIGYQGQRQLDLIELDVVTGNGEIITTRPATQGAASLGLDLTQLFVQTALGVVVGARLRLIPRTDGGGAAIVRLKDATRFPDLLEGILKLKREGAITGVPHMANRERIFTTMAPWVAPSDLPRLAGRTNPWTVAVPVTGSRRMTEAAFTQIGERLSSFCEIETIFASHCADSKTESPAEQLQLLISGYPSNLALAGVEWTALGTANPRQIDPEATGAGLIHVTPSVRSSATDIQRALSVIQEGAWFLGLDTLPLTVNVVDQCMTVIVISIGFPREEVAKYRSKARKLEARLAEAGLRPYRIGLGQEGWVPSASKEARGLYRKLKAAFDPKRIFATSKYESAYRSPSRSRRTKSPNIPERQADVALEVA